jgi:hypothetical protein
MADQNTENANARSGRAVVDDQPAKDGAHAGQSRPEPASYAAPDWRDASLAPPASGEVTDFFDEGEPSGGMQQGADRTRTPEHDTQHQGEKTRAANVRMTRTGSPDQGTH